MVLAKNTRELNAVQISREAGMRKEAKKKSCEESELLYESAYFLVVSVLWTFPCTRDALCATFAEL